MKINFTKKQYQILLKIIFCGNWILNAQKIGDDIDEEIESLCSYVKSFAKEFGLEDWIQYDKDMKSFYLTQEKEFEFHDFIEKYEEERFWTELLDRLVARDIRVKYTEEEWKSFDMKEKFEIRMNLEKKYEEEFEKNGLENFKLFFLRNI